MNVLKKSKSKTGSVTSLRRSQNVNLNIFHEIGFYGNFSIFPDAKCTPGITKPEQNKNINKSHFGPIMAWDHKRTSSGRCVPAWL